MNGADFGRYSEDYAAHRPGFPGSFFERLGGIISLDGTRVLDLATGPGTIALDLATRGSTVIGVDVAANQIAVAERLARDRGLDENVTFHVSGAENTGLDSAFFDLVTVGQAWHWFDGTRVMREIRRVLRPGGVLVIAYYSYLAEHSPVVRDTEDLILEMNPAWGMAGSTGTFPAIIDEVIRGGFDLMEQFCYDEEEPFTHERWRGRMRTCNGVGSGGLAPDQVQRFDAALASLLHERHAEPVLIPHRVWCVVCRTPS